MEATDKQKSFMDSLGIQYDANVSKQDAKLMIDRKLGKLSSTPKAESPKQPNQTASYYVAYAKDLVIAMMSQERYAAMSTDVLMTMAIDTIKQAQRAF